MCYRTVPFLVIGCASASAATPLLQFETPGSVLPVPFTAEGGPVHCQSGEAGQDEIRTPPVNAELVFIDQARREVGVLLAPDGGVYMSFECAGESVEAIGPFLSPVGPLNQESSSFTATLSRLGPVQFPAEYESADGLRKQAIPTAVPLTASAITAAEVEAKQRDEEAAAKKRQDEEAAKRSEEERAKEKARGRQLSQALKQCRRTGSKRARVRCEHRAKKRFAVPHPNRRHQRLSTAADRDPQAEVELRQLEQFGVPRLPGPIAQVCP